MGFHAKSMSLYVLVWAQMYENRWRPHENFVHKLAIDYLCSKLELVIVNMITSYCRYEHKQAHISLYKQIHANSNHF